MSDQLTPDQVDEIQDCLARGQKIAAIKKYREFTGQGLREAKEFIEALWPQLSEQNPERFPPPAGNSGAGCAVLLVVVVLLGGTLATVLIS